MIGENVRIASLGLRRRLLAASKGREDAARFFRARGGEDRNREHLHVRGRGDDAQRGRQRRIVLRREQRGDEHQIGDTIADRVEGLLGRAHQNQLGAHTFADDGRQMGRLAAVWFDRKNERHPRFAA